MRMTLLFCLSAMVTLSAYATEKKKGTFYASVTCPHETMHIFKDVKDGEDFFQLYHQFNQVTTYERAYTVFKPTMVEVEVNGERRTRTKVVPETRVQTIQCGHRPTLLEIHRFSADLNEMFATNGTVKYCDDTTRSLILDHEFEDDKVQLIDGSGEQKPQECTWVAPSAEQVNNIDTK